MKIHHDDTLKRRAAAYPSRGDQLGALWKAVAALAAGEPIPTDAQTVLDEVQAVKAKYKKRGGA